MFAPLTLSRGDTTVPWKSITTAIRGMLVSENPAERRLALLRRERQKISQNANTRQSGERCYRRLGLERS